MTLLHRLAQAKGPGRELDLVVAVAVNYGEVWGDAEWRWGPDADPVSNKGGLVDGLRFVPPFTASLDAVLRLLPEGWRFGFEMAGQYDANDLCEAWAWPYESSFDPDWRNGDQGYRSAPDGHRAAHKDVVNAALQVVLRARGIE